jgi:Mg-chelatase subunit ChlD
MTTYDWSGNNGGSPLELRFTEWQKEKQEREKERAARLIASQEKVASVLCLRPISTYSVPSSPYPAWSGSSSIGYALNHLGDLHNAYSVMAAKGYTIHEIAHILFTPRAASPFRQWVIQNGLNTAFQVAEDSRIEFLLIGRFGSSISAWLNAAVIRHLLKPETEIGVQYPLYVGRTYVPLNIREVLRSAYFDQASVADIQRLVLEYREIVFDSQERVVRAKEIIVELAKLLSAVGLDNLDDPFGHSTRPANEGETSDSRPLPYEQQKRANNAGKRRNEPIDSGTTQVGNDQTPYEPQPDGCFPQPTNSGDYGDLGNPLPSGNGGGYGDGGNDDGKGGDGKGGESNDPSNSPTNSNGAGKGGNALPDAIRGMFSQELDKQLDRVRNDLRKEMRLLNGAMELDGSGNVKEPRKARHNLKTLEPEVFASAKKFGLELSKIRTENEPAWEKQTDNGRLNASRYLRNCELDVAFDRFTNGRQDATEIECVILLDNSGSMSGYPAEQAYRAMYAIKKGLQEINARCSVITYNSSAETLYSADEKVSNQVKDAGAGGGTEPQAAIEFAYATFANSNKAVKLLITITDGEWGNTPEVDELVAEMRSSGVLTAFALIANHELRETHNFEITTRITNTARLLDLAKAVVRIAIGRKLSVAV